MKYSFIELTFMVIFTAAILLVSGLAYGSSVIDNIDWVVISDPEYGHREDQYEQLEGIGVDAIVDEISWAETEPYDGGYYYDFSAAMESYLACRAAGLVWIPQLAVHYKPYWLREDDYHYKYSDGTYHTDNDMPPNYFNSSTQYYIERYIEGFADYFRNHLDDIPLIYISIGHYGEAYYPGGDNFAAFDSYTIAAWRTYTGDASAVPYSSSTADDGTGGTLEEFYDFWYGKMYDYIEYTSAKFNEELPDTKIALKTSYNPDIGQVMSEQVAAALPYELEVISFGGPTSQHLGMEEVGSLALENNITAWVESFLRDYGSSSNSIDLTKARLMMNNISGMMYATMLNLISANYPEPPFQLQDEYYLYQQLISEYDNYVEGFTTWYLAEGATLGDYDTWVLIMNPTLNTANIRATFMKSDGTTEIESISLGGQSRYSINVNAIIPSDSVSTKVESINNIPIVVERAMYWDSGGGHCSIGVTAPDDTWYLAEGSTSGFDTWVLVQNPNVEDSIIRMTFMDSGGNTVEELFSIGANSRFTRKVNDVPGMNNQSGVATKVETLNNVDVITERAMYWDTGGGHCSAGVNSPAELWYLAEGSTVGYETWVLVQNPDADNYAEVTFTYMDNDGNTVTEDTIISPNGRYTRQINDVSGMNNKYGVSTKVEATNEIGIIAERAMYWDSSDGIARIGGHACVGVTTPGVMWFLPEGCTTDPYDEWILIQNPNNVAAVLKITFMRTDGTYERIDATVYANSRSSINVDAVYALDAADVSTIVESTNGVTVIVERAMYWGNNGHVSIGKN